MDVSVSVAWRDGERGNESGSVFLSPHFVAQLTNAIPSPYHQQHHAPADMTPKGSPPHPRKTINKDPSPPLPYPAATDHLKRLQQRAQGVGRRPLSPSFARLRRCRLSLLDGRAVQQLVDGLVGPLRHLAPAVGAVAPLLCVCLLCVCVCVRVCVRVCVCRSRETNQGEGDERKGGERVKFRGTFRGTFWERSGEGKKTMTAPKVCVRQFKLECATCTKLVRI